MEELNKEEIERLSILRNSMMSPYVAQGWDIKADYPKERRIVLKKDKKFSGWAFFLFGFWNWFIGSIIYLIIWAITKEQEKTLMY